MFVTGTKLLVRRGSGILNFRDLAGKTVVLTRGTVHETAIPKLAERQKIPIKFVFAADHQESFQTLAAGKADAFANDDVQLYGMLAETKSGADFRVVGDFLTYADYALMFRKDDPEFAEVVERAFHRARRQPRDRRDLRALVPEAAAVRRAPQPADEPAPRGALPRAGPAVGLTAMREPRIRTSRSIHERQSRRRTPWVS